MAGKEKMTSVSSTPPSRRLSVSGATRRSRDSNFEFTVPRQPRQRVSSERSSRSSTPVRSSSRAVSPAETRSRTPSRPSSRASTPQPKKKRNNELDRLLISAVNDGQRRLLAAGEAVAAAKKGGAMAKSKGAPKKKVPLAGARKALEKAKKVVPVKTKPKPALVKGQIKKAKAKLVAKKNAVQLKKIGGPAKKTELKAKPVESKINGSKKEDSTVVVVKKPEEIKPKAPQEPASKPVKIPSEEAPKVRKSSCDEAPKTRKSVSREDSVKTPEVAKSDPIKELREALTESLKAQNEPPSEPKEELPKKPDEVSKVIEARREDKPKVDVMQTLTEACRKLEQLKSKKKEAPVLEVAPRSPEGAAMTTEKLPEMEKSLKNSVISPVNMQAKLRNKLSQSPSTEAKEGTIALTLPPMSLLPPLSSAPIINSLSAAAKQTSSFLKDAEAPVEYRWRIDKRLSMLAPLNACIKGKVADLLRKNPNEVVLKENKRKEPEVEEEMEELRLSESESESVAASPEKTMAKVPPVDEAPVVKSDKAESPSPPESEAIESGIDILPEVEEEKEEIIATPEPEKAKEEQEMVSETVTEQVVEQPPEGAMTQETEEEAKETPPEEALPELDTSAETAGTTSKAAKKLTKHRKEIDRKKRRREEYRKKKIDAIYQFEDDPKLPEEEPVASESALSLSSLSSSSDDVVVSHLEPREEDITAKESVLGALGLQSTRLAQQERPKVPKLKLVVRPTPAKKKGHKSENGNEKTYAICHEGDGEEGQKSSHRKKSLWYPGLPISNGELAKLILTTPTISDLIIGRHLGEAKPPQPGIGVGDGLDSEAELGHKGAKKREEVVIPEKTAASNVHPGRPCEDVCCYCHNKFGLFDTPLHVSQLKGGSEKQSAVLAREPVLTLASCVCDACFRHLDRPLASIAAWRPQPAKAKKREASTCCFGGCGKPAPHPLVKKWKRRVRGMLSRGLDPKSGLFLCHQHHQETSKTGACVMCARRLASSQLYCLEPQATEPFNEVLRQDLIPLVVRPEADLCKKCRYYSSLRLRCADYTKLSVSNRTFLRAHREKIIKIICPSSEYAMVEVFPEVPKPLKKMALMLPPPSYASTSSCPSTSSSAPKRTLLTPSVEIIPVPAEGPPPPKKSKGSMPPPKEAVTVRLVGAASTSSAAASAQPRRPLVKRTATRNEGPNLTFQWLGETGPPRGKWHTTRADIQMDDRTLAEWKKRQEPFGSYTSYVKHLVTLDGFWRAKQLGPLPSASAACTKYCTSVRNRIEAYEGMGEEAEELGQPRICDVRSLAP